MDLYEGQLKLKEYMKVILMEMSVDTYLIDCRFIFQVIRDIYERLF